ncbi:MAG: UvrD-helicase domain-containing protein [Actinobacteria bacterium]|nr:UvrD-helicase domain-containing protein [Actinomycetota bacterium]
MTAAIRDDDLFDLAGPLPTGVTVLEASAGTGKTFTIAGLALRYVAGGIPLPEILLVTFTRMATGELRERVRERFVTAERGLRQVIDGGAAPEGDEVLELLAGGSDGARELRLERISKALADFDAATIATTHGFCQHVLSGLGVAGDVEADSTFIEDARDLVEEVVDDLYVRKFRRDGKPPFSRDEALRIATTVVDNSRAEIEPKDDFDPKRLLRQKLANAVLDEVEVRKRRQKVITYDDLLTRLLHTLEDPDRGPAAIARLRSRYRVALVDEFQDTDPVQWEILRLAFAESARTLVLIGDPKQAIYAFRGADVYAYLRAAAVAGTRATLATNRRSDQGLIDAYDALFGNARLGHAEIVYRTVCAVPQHQRPRLVGAPEGAALRVRVVHRDDGNVETTPKTGAVKAASGRAHIAADLAADVVRLLSSGAPVIDRDGDGEEVSRQTVGPGHLAVLVRSNRHASLVREALAAAGVPAVINGAGSVFATPVARDWWVLLEALERPSAPARVRALALSSFVGWNAEEVAVASDRDWELLHARVHRWSALLRQRGVASLLELVTRTEALPSRVLRRADGERLVTDLRHIGELLHLEAHSGRLGVAALTAWLRQRIDEARRDVVAEERSRRLESDNEAVQVITVHRSKGLEFPIVFVPFAWEPPFVDEERPAIFHDPANGDARTIDVAMSGDDFDEHRRLESLEELGEDLRLLYVALTRAQHQAVVWWASGWDCEQSALGRLLFAREGDGAVLPRAAEPIDEIRVCERLRELAVAAPGQISVERTTGGGGPPWRGTQSATAALATRSFDRRIDEQWRRTSYSGLTAQAYEARVASEIDEPRLNDEDLAAEANAIDTGDDGAGADLEAALRAVLLPLASMPGGADVGSLVHAVFEHTDFRAADLRAELQQRLDGQAWRHVDAGDHGVLVDGLCDAIDTPLGPLVSDARLRDVSGADRLDELAFELPLAGGDQPRAELTMEMLASVVDEHLPAGDILAGYAERLRYPQLAQALRGYLTGSIDVVLRTRSRDGQPRFVVVDYKTNWLGLDGEELTAWHYRPAAMADAMRRGDYPLQALIYSVALHRYLRWRLPGYEPERNLGGVLYLFVRGMAGQSAPRVGEQPCGVFAWQPPASLIVGWSDAFDRGRER